MAFTVLVGCCLARRADGLRAARFDGRFHPAIFGRNPAASHGRVPCGVRIFSGDYAPASNQILYTDRAHAAGPASHNV